MPEISRPGVGAGDRFLLDVGSGLGVGRNRRDRGMSEAVAKACVARDKRGEGSKRSENIEVGSWRSSVGDRGRFLLDVGFGLGVGRNGRDGGMSEAVAKACVARVERGEGSKRSENIEVGSWRSSVGDRGRFLLDVGFGLGVWTRRYVGCGNEGFALVAYDQKRGY